MPETSFEREVLDRLTKIEAKIDTFDSAKSKIYENEKELIKIRNYIHEQDERIKNLEESSKWLSRTTGAAIITALIGVVFTFIKIGAGI